MQGPVVTSDPSLTVKSTSRLAPFVLLSWYRQESFDDLRGLGALRKFLALFGPWFFVSWACLVWVGLALLGGVWDPLLIQTNSLVEPTLLEHPTKLALFGLVFVVLRAAHTLVCAGVVKHVGGSVDRLGLAFVGLPVPFFDASLPARTPKAQLAVAGTGIVVESGLALIGLIVWAMVETGWVSEVAFATMLVGGLWSVLFNANPLIRLDGHQILTAVLQLPSLHERANRCARVYLQKKLLRIPHSARDGAAPGQYGFLFYAGTVWVYRLLLAFWVVGLLFSLHAVTALLAALGFLVAWVLVPVAKSVRWVVFDPALGQFRYRALTFLFAWLGLGGLLFAWLPLPHVTHVGGTVAPLEVGVIRASTDCLVEAVLVTNGSRVTPGTGVVRCEPVFHRNKLAVLAAEERLARAEVFAATLDTVREQRKTLLKQTVKLRRQARAELKQTITRTQIEGALFIPEANRLIGRFVRKGEVMGYVRAPESVAIKSRVPEVLAATHSRDLAHYQHVEVFRSGAQTRAGVSALKRSPVSGVDGALQLQLQLPQNMADAVIGETVSVRFHHGWDTPAGWLVRQLHNKIRSAHAPS